MNDKDRVRLNHIQSSIADIESFMINVSSEEFMKNRMFQNAVIRSFEIIGEAIQAISDELKSNHSEINWKDWKNFRNVLIHQYFGIDLKMIQFTILNELPELKKSITSILEEENG